MDGLRIGELAERASVGVETLRYYERRGVIERPPRTASNYRAYPPEAVRRVRFVKRAQALGFSLEEAKELLELRAGPRACRGRVRERAAAKVAEIDRKIRDLRRVRRALAALVAECEGAGSGGPACPILDALGSDGCGDGVRP